jgi:hypothetical protein
MKNKQIFLKEFGRVLINLGNITFASLVIGSIIKSEYGRILLVSVCAALALITAGLILLVKGGKE